MARLFWPVTLTLLAILGAVQVVTARGESQTWDEGIHLAAGYAYLKSGDYAWNSEHPPLVKLMSALPLLPLKPLLPVDLKPWEQRDIIVLARDFIYRNRVHADVLLFRGRVMTIALTVLGGLLLALWTRRRFGAPAALLALAFYALDPNLIAHGRYITTDAAMAVFFFLTCAAWTEYLLSNRRRDLALAAGCFALALVVKFSAVLLAPVIVMLYGVRWLQRPKEFPLRRLALAAGAAVLACAVIVAAVYWRETVRAVRSETADLAESVDRTTLTGRALYRAGRWFGLPQHAFLTGLDKVATHNRSGHHTYLLGRRSDTGWWYYFPVVFAVKSTLAALAGVALLLAAGAWRLARGRFREIPLPWIAMTAPPLFWFVVSMTSAINLGIRHILPVYPPLYVALGALIASIPAARELRYAALSLAALQAAECASIHPHYLAFFNAAAGGPASGPKYLVDSNIDWGQDVKKLKSWLEAHGTRTVWINYFGGAIVRYYDIEENSLPAAKETAAWDAIDGYVAVSATPLQGVYVPYEEFAPVRRRPVVARIGYSIYVYDFRKTR